MTEEVRPTYEQLQDYVVYLQHRLTITESLLSKIVEKPKWQECDKYAIACNPVEVYQLSQVGNIDDFFPDAG